MAKGGIKGGPGGSNGNSGQIIGTEGDDILIGTEGDDSLIDGGAGNDTIFGLGGNDFIKGGDGDDIIDGGSGDDVIRPGTGNDVVDGGDGIDTLDYLDFMDGSVIDLEAGTATIFVGDSSFTDSVINFEILWATKGDDMITGSSGNDEIHALSGDDTIDAGAGDDIVLAGAGADVIIGGAGSDTLTGGKGGFADTFIFNAADFGAGESDTITDFGGADTLVLDGLVVLSIDTSQNVGGRGKTDTIISLDADGDGLVDGTIIVLDTSLSESDLTLI